MSNSKIFYEGSTLYKSLQSFENEEIFKSLTNKNFLITGGVGFIIRYFIYLFLYRNDKFESNNKLIVLVRNIDKAKALYGELLDRDDFIIIKQDVCEEICVDYDIDYIIHAAGQSNPSRIKEDPVGTFNANVLGTRNILQFANSKQVAAVLYISSYMVYGGIIKREIIDTPHAFPIDFTNVDNCYAESKRAGEMLCNCYNQQYNTPIKIARPSFVFGASDENDKRVWSEIIRNVARDENVILNSNGMSMRPVCYVMDVVRALIYILIKGESCIGYNIESNITTIRQFAIEATNCENTGSKLLFKNKEDEIDCGEINIPDDMKYADRLLLKNLGWSPLWRMKEAINESIGIQQDKSL